MLYVGPEAYAKPLVVCQRQGYGHNTMYDFLPRTVRNKRYRLGKCIVGMAIRFGAPLQPPRTDRERQD